MCDALWKCVAHPEKTKEEGVKKMGMSKHFRFIFLLPFFLIFVSRLFSQGLQVSNVRFEDRGETIVVKYELSGTSGRKYKVSLLLSDDYGVSFNIKPRAVFGDVGKSIKPGLGKQITWYMKKDFPNGLKGEGFVFAVDAELQKGKSKFSLYFLGTGIVGGVVYFVAKSKGGKTTPTTPTTGSIVITVPDNF